MGRKIGEKWTALPTGAVDQSQVRQAASVDRTEQVGLVGFERKRGALCPVSDREPLGDTMDQYHQTCAHPE